MLNKNWNIVMRDEFKKEYFSKLKTIVQNEYRSKIIFPKFENIFKAFQLTDYNEVKVVIIGQDPYHGFNQAHGLAFSILEGNPLPPSLQNIFTELRNDLNINRKSGNLEDWAKQGVFLLNTILTVEKGKPLSHANIGWEIFTREAIKKLNEKKDPVIFVLLGNQAKNNKEFITNPNHYVIESTHPSPFSVHKGFFGSRIFSRINQILKKVNKEEIKW